MRNFADHQDGVFDVLMTDVGTVKGREAKITSCYCYKRESTCAISLSVKGALSFLAFFSAIRHLNKKKQQQKQKKS